MKEEQKHYAYKVVSAGHYSLYKKRYPKKYRKRYLLNKITKAPKIPLELSFMLQKNKQSNQLSYGV